jgi:chloramphenicol 3-O phosphotransferase
MGNRGRRGQIIFLNGTSSSGKSSIAGQLLRMLDPPHFHMSVDAINSMRAKQKTRELDDAELEAVLARTRAGFHRAVAGMAEAGNDVIADHVLSEPWRLRDCLEVMADYRVVFVGVRCSPAELERRERERGDRPPGVALAQQARCMPTACMTSSVTPRRPVPTTAPSASRTSSAPDRCRPPSTGSGHSCSTGRRPVRRTVLTTADRFAVMQ